MKNFQHIEKSGFHRGQYVGYGGGKVWTIHPSMSSYGKWRAFIQRNPGEYRYGWTLTELDTYFHTPFPKRSTCSAWPASCTLTGRLPPAGVLPDLCKPSSTP